MVAFRPDLFSDPVPRFSPSERGEVRRVVEMLEALYPQLGPFGAIERCGGIEINSRNYRVSAAANSLIVKQASVSLEDAGEITGFAAFARERGVPVPRICANQTGHLVTSHGGSVWYVMEDAGGDYFSGDRAEVPALARLFAALWELGELPEAQRPARILPLLDLADLATAESFERRLGQAGSLLGEREAAALAPLWPELRRKLDVALDRLATAPPAFRAMHMDLHPHNVMMRGDGSALALDLDSLQTCAGEVAVAFGCYKMSRQAASRAGSVEAGRDCAGAILGSLGAQVPAAPNALAEAEILRRIALILRLALEDDRRWSFVLPTQLRSLEEAQELLPG